MLQIRDNILLILLKIVFVAFNLSVRKNPDMGVRNFISNNPAQNPFIIERFLLSSCDLRNNFEILAGIRNVPNPAIMLLRNDLCVARRLRMNIEKSQKIVIFIDDMRGNFSLDNFTENAVGHVSII